MLELLTDLQLLSTHEPSMNKEKAPPARDDPGPANSWGVNIQHPVGEHFEDKFETLVTGQHAPARPRLHRGGGGGAEKTCT